MGSPGPQYVCQRPCEYAFARVCLAMLSPRWAGQSVVFEGFSLGTEKGWERLGQHREMADLLTKPHHGDRRSSFLMPS